MKSPLPTEGKYSVYEGTFQGRPSWFVQMDDRKRGAGDMLFPDRESAEDGARQGRANEEQRARSLAEQQARLRSLQMQIHRQRLPVLLLFEGWDAAGKGGAISRFDIKTNLSADSLEAAIDDRPLPAEAMPSARARRRTNQPPTTAKAGVT